MDFSPFYEVIIYDGHMMPTMIANNEYARKKHNK